MAEKKLAIVISGAVSLGSYEAGVMYEVISAIGQHNLQAAEGEKILIDVITGASAGGMTAAVLAQKLLFEADSLEHPTKNALYNAWVELIDIQGLLRTDLDDPPLASLLSSNEVAKIADKLLLTRYQNPGTTKTHPSAAPQIRLGLAMSNLNGLDYSIPISNADDLCARQGDSVEFTYTKFQDSYIRTVDNNRDTKEFWQEIGLAARACGAFPFAFRPLDVLRNTNDPDEQKIATASNIGEAPKKFTYADGGMFHNEPLGMAKGLVDKIDTEPNDYMNRYFLYVSPDPKSSAANKDFNEAKADLVNTSAALIKSIFNQARYQDWINVREINLKIDRFDKQAEWLAKVMQQEPEKMQSFSIVTETLLESLYAEESEARQADYTRLRDQFNDIYPELPDKIATIWLSAVQLLERAAGLGGKDLMTVYSITAEPNETASELLYAFSGFMERRFRVYDYQLGRYKAQEFLGCLKSAVENHNGPGKSPMPLKYFSLDRVDKPEPDLSKAKVTDIDELNRRNFLERALGRLKLVVEDKVKGWFKRALAKLMAGKFAKSFLKKWLELKRRWWPPSAW